MRALARCSRASRAFATTLVSSSREQAERSINLSDTWCKPPVRLFSQCLKGSLTGRPYLARSVNLADETKKSLQSFAFHDICLLVGRPEADGFRIVGLLLML